MAIPPWTYELLRRGIADVARRAHDTDAVERIKQQASELLQDLPEAAAKGIDAVIKKTESGRKSVEKWTKRQTHDSSPIINASGTLLNPKGTGVTMASQVIELGEEVIGGDINQQVINRRVFDQRLQRLIASKDHSHAICIAASSAAAITSIAMLNPNATFYLRRSQIENHDLGQSLQTQLDSLVKVEIIEDDPTASNRQPLDASSFELVIQDGCEEKLERDPVDDHQRILIANTCMFSVALGHQIPNCQTLLQYGFDWLIVPGNGLFGGPPCGVVVGPRADVEKLQCHPIWSSVEAKENTLLMMLMTLEMESSQPDAIPIIGLLKTSLDNIRSRSERIATRIGANEKIAECQIRDSEASVSPGVPWKIPSQSLRLRHKTLQAKQWSNQLAEEHPLILTTCDDEYLYLDLRWVDPSHDAQLGQIIGGPIQ